MGANEGQEDKSIRVLVKAEEVWKTNSETGEKVRWLKCLYCKGEWYPNIGIPKYCPMCKREISKSISQLEEKKRIKEEKIKEVVETKYIVPEFFTPECARCGKDANKKYKGEFLCIDCMIEELRKEKE